MPRGEMNARHIWDRWSVPTPPEDIQSSPSPEPQKKQQYINFEVKSVRYPGVRILVEMRKELAESQECQAHGGIPLFRLSRVIDAEGTKNVNTVNLLLIAKQQRNDLEQLLKILDSRLSHILVREANQYPLIFGTKLQTLWSMEFLENLIDDVQAKSARYFWCS